MEGVEGMGEEDTSEVERICVNMNKDAETFFPIGGNCASHPYHDFVRDEDDKIEDNSEHAGEIAKHADNTNKDVSFTHDHTYFDQDNKYIITDHNI